MTVELDKSSPVPNGSGAGFVELADGERAVAIRAVEGAQDLGPLGALARTSDAFVPEPPNVAQPPAVERFNMHQTVAQTIPLPILDGKVLVVVPPLGKHGFDYAPEIERSVARAGIADGDGIVIRAGEKIPESHKFDLVIDSTPGFHAIWDDPDQIMGDFRRQLCRAARVISIPKGDDSVNVAPYDEVFRVAERYVKLKKAESLQIVSLSHSQSINSRLVEIRADDDALPKTIGRCVTRANIWGSVEEEPIGFTEFVWESNDIHRALAHPGAGISLLSNGDPTDQDRIYGALMYYTDPNNLLPTGAKLQAALRQLGGINDQSMGYVEFFLKSVHGTVLNRVATGAHRINIFQTLEEQAIAAAREAGCTALCSLVRRSPDYNRLALDLYKRSGWELAGVQYLDPLSKSAVSDYALYDAIIKSI